MSVVYNILAFLLIVCLCTTFRQPYMVGAEYIDLNGTQLFVSPNGDMMKNINSTAVVLPPSTAAFSTESGDLYDWNSYEPEMNVSIGWIVVLVIVSTIISLLLTLFISNKIVQYNSMRGHADSKISQSIVMVVIFIILQIATVNVSLWFVHTLNLQVVSHSMVKDTFALSGVTSAVLSPNQGQTASYPQATLPGNVVGQCFGTMILTGNTSIYYQPVVTPVYTQRINVSVIYDYNVFFSQQCTWFGMTDPCMSSKATVCLSYHTQVQASFFDCFGADQYKIGWVQAYGQYSLFRGINVTKAATTLAHTCIGNCSLVWKQNANVSVSTFFINDPTINHPMGVVTNGTHWIDYRFTTASVSLVSTVKNLSQIVADLVIGQGVDGSPILQRVDPLHWFLETPYCSVSYVTGGAIYAPPCLGNQFTFMKDNKRSIYIISPNTSTACSIAVKQNTTIWTDDPQLNILVKTVHPNQVQYLVDVDSYNLTDSTNKQCITPGWCSVFLSTDLGGTFIQGTYDGVYDEDLKPKVWSYVNGQQTAKITNAIYAVLAIITLVSCLAGVVYYLYQRKKMTNVVSSSLVEMYQRQIGSDSLII